MVNIKFDIQLFAISWSTTEDTTYYYASGGASKITTADLTDDTKWSTTEPADTNNYLIAVVNGGTLKSLKAYTGVSPNDYTTATPYDGTITDNASTTKGTVISANLTFTAPTYKLNLTDSTGNITVSTKLKTGDIITLSAADKVATINSISYTASTATTLQGNASGVPVLTAGGLKLSSVSSREILIGTAATAGSAPTGVETVTFTGSGTLAADGAVTALSTNATVTGVPTGKTVTLASEGSATVNGVKFSQTGTALSDVGFTTTTGTTTTLITLGAATSFTTGTGAKTFTVVSHTGDLAVKISGDATNTFKKISDGVTLTAGTAAADAYATLTAGKSVSVIDASNIVVASVTGDVTVTAAGALDDLQVGEKVKIGNETLAITKNSAGKAIITYSGDTTKTYQFKGDNTTLAIANVSSISLATETEIEEYTPDTIYSVLSNGGTATLVSTLETKGKLSFANDSSGSIVYATQQKTSDTAYTLVYTNQAQTLSNGITVDISALPKTATLTVTKSGAPDTVYYKTADGTFQVATGNEATFTVQGDVVNTVVTGAASDLTITSGTITLGNGAATTNVITNAGTFEVKEGGTVAATEITSEGVFTGIDSAADTTTNYVKLQADSSAQEGATTAFSVNGTSFSAVSTVGATVANYSGTLILSAGSLLVSGSTVNIGNTNTRTVKVSGGDGVIVTSTGLVSGLNEGETVTITDTNTALVAGVEKSVYTVTNGVLQVATYTNATDTTPAGQAYYTLTGDAISFSAINTPTSGEYDLPTTLGASIGVTGGTATASEKTVEGKALYLQKDGTTALASDSKTIGTLTTTSDTATYEAASGAKGQTIGITAGSTGVDSVNWVLTTTSNADTINYTATSDATINSGAGKDTITIGTANTNAEIQVNAGDGNNTVNLTSTGSVTVSVGSGKNTVNATGAGSYNIALGSGGGTVTRTAGTGNGNATITGGSGKDTISAAGADDAVTGGDGADTFNVTAASMTIKDYVYGTDVIQAVTTATAPTINKSWFGADGVATIASGITADVSAGTGTGEFYAVSLVDSNGKNKQNVAWAKEGGSTIDITTYDQAVTLIGDADGKNALYAGTKADTIYSYADGDSVYGGAGKDSISLAANGSGRVVGVGTASGKDSVAGFTASFEEGDSIYMVDGSASDVKASFANNTVTFKDGEGSLQLNGVATNSTTGAVELNVSGVKVALAAASVGGAIAADSTSYADFYMGNGAGVSFATAEGEVNVDLRNGLDSGAEGAKFSGITAVTGGAGNNTLIGGTAAESIYAGTGASSLWGGAGKDSLIGSTASDAFFIGAGDGSDVVTNFSAAGNENADTVYALNDITGAKLTSNGVEISVGDTDKITLKNVTADTAIKFNSNGNAGVAKVGSATTANNFSYDSTVTYYGGGSKSDKIAFASGSTENAQIWLDGSQGKAYASIDVVDGANTSGNLLVAGDSSSQSIIGGKGDTSLWGGAGSATDTLRSSSGSKTMFWWGAGEGNDVVVSASADDSVNLYNLKLSDVDVANSSITNSGVSLALNDGSKLTVQTSRDMTFSIDGQSWTAQHSSKEWKQNS